MHDRYARLVRLISDYVDRNFRAAFQYDERDWTALYVRPDLATEDLQAAVPAGDRPWWRVRCMGWGDTRRRAGSLFGGVGLSGASRAPARG